MHAVGGCGKCPLQADYLTQMCQIIFGVVGSPWLGAKCSPKLLCHSPPQLNKKEKMQGTAHKLRQEQGGVTHRLPSLAKHTWKN